MDSGTPANTPEVTLTSNDPELTTPGESARSTVTLLERRQLGHYLLLDELGRGGMGVVYLAHDSKLGRKVAIKMLKSEGGAKLQRRLIREAQAMAKLAHPNVVSVHEIGEHDGTAFIVMDYVEGQTLRQWLAAARRSVPEILAVFIAAGRGLAAIHEAGFIHRDFKPDNLMIRDSGQVLVMDLGIARAGSGAGPTMADLDVADSTLGDLTRDGTLLGSPAYMAAEQFSGGEVTPKTDQFSFCVALWQALYGERPFAGDHMATLIESVTEGRLRAGKRSDVPAVLRSVLERGLRADPQARFESMTALLAALERASGSRMRTQKGLAWGVALLVGLAAIFVAVRVAVDRASSTIETVIEALPTGPTPRASEPVLADPTRPRQITTTGTATMPALSPDGNHVVFVDEGSFVHVDLRSGETKKLAPKVRFVLVSQLSNDGALLFSAQLDGTGGVYQMPSLDAAPVRVEGALTIFCKFPANDRVVSFDVDHKVVTLSNVKGWLDAELPVPGEFEWLREVACDPRNNRVAVLHLLGETTTLKLIDLDEGPARVLFENSVGLSSPQFDQTGDTLYYLAHRDEQTNLEATGTDYDLPVTRIVVSNIDATTFSRADSGRVAFARTQTVHRGIWRFRAADNSLERAERIVETDAEEVRFAVSPDETQLAYVESRRNLGALTIRTLSDGSEREVTRGDRLEHIAWSPDGQTIAFSAPYRGQVHVWTVPAAGGVATVLERALASDAAALAWAPSERIVYPRPDYRNFGLLDPNTEDDRPLIGDDSVGWAFFPAVSPNGDSVALLWRWAHSLGVWVIDIEAGTQRLLIDGEYYPNTWSVDGRFVYAADGWEKKSTVKLYRIPAEPAGEGGGPLEPWRAVEFGPRNRGTCHVLSTEELLCDVVESTSDIWIAEAIE